MTNKSRKPASDGQATRKLSGGGTEVIWPRGLQERYGISDVTRWRWERENKLPPRDVFVGGRSGWKPATLAAYESGQRHAA